MFALAHEMSKQKCGILYVGRTARENNGKSMLEDYLICLAVACAVGVQFGNIGTGLCFKSIKLMEERKTKLTEERKEER